MGKDFVESRERRVVEGYYRTDGAPGLWILGCPSVQSRLTGWRTRMESIVDDENEIRPSTRRATF